MSCKLSKKPSSKRLLAPTASSPAASAAMRGNKSRDTSPELLLRSALWRHGTRGFRKHPSNIPGRPDVAFPRHRLAVFVNGCFWHCYPHCNISTPRTNTAYWEEKLRRNAERDDRVILSLRDLGWQTLRLWECEVRESPESCVAKINRLLQGGCSSDIASIAMCEPIRKRLSSAQPTASLAYS